MYCESKEGQLLENLDERLERRAEYFQEILNEDKQTYRETRNRPSHEEKYPQPEDDEIDNIIKMLKDSISAEAINHGGDKMKYTERSLIKPGTAREENA